MTLSTRHDRGWPSSLRRSGRRLLTPALALAVLASVLTLGVVASPPAQGAPLQGTTLITWNMQGEEAGRVSGGKWQNTVRHLIRQVPIMLLQEVGAGPPSSMRDADTSSPIPSVQRTTRDGHVYRNALWAPDITQGNPIRGDRGVYEVNFLQTDSNGGTGTGGRVNIAVLTHQVPDEVRAVENPVSAGRAALGVRFDNDWYFTFHGLSGGGGDSAVMLDAIDDAVTAWGRSDGRDYDWTVGGDFNADPEFLYLRTDFPPGAQPYSSGEATHESGSELDYAVSNRFVGSIPAYRLDGAGSDHYPVQIGGPRAAAEPVPLIVKPLGDSITYGINHSAGVGYRDPLYELLMASSLVYKRSVDFVGSRRSGEMSDADHEGHPGWRIDQIAGIADCSVPSFRPNVVLLHAGTNDMNQDYRLASAPDRLRDLIDQVLEDAPETTVLVATLIPSVKAGMQAKIDRYNAALPGVVQDLREEGKRVRMVDMASALTPADVDGSHPHDDGYRKMADTWLDALYSAADEGLLQEPRPGTGVACTGEEGGDPVSAAGPGWHALGVVAPGMSTPAGRTDLVDLNADDRADYVRIAADGSVRAALNTQGEPGKPEWQDQGFIIPAPPGETNAGEKVRFADIDGNGTDDYLLVDDDSSVRAWYTSASGFKLMYGGVIAPGIEGATGDSIRFADVDGDGRDDYLRVGDTGAVHAYINTPKDAGGNAISWEEHRNWAPGVAHGSRGKLRLADVNGDRRADYLIVGNTGAVHAYLNDGLGNGFTEKRYFVNEIGYPGERATFRDISGDGKADYVVVYHGGSVRAWLNRGGNPGGGTDD